MREDLIFLDLEFDSSKEFLGYVSDELEQRGYVKESFKNSIIKREECFPTGIPLGYIGIAIPHSDSEHIIEPGISLVRFKKDVSFISMTGEENVSASLAFVLLVKEKEKQVLVLQSLMEFITDKEKLLSLKNAESKKEIIKILEGVNL